MNTATASEDPSSSVNETGSAGRTTRGVDSSKRTVRRLSPGYLGALLSIFALAPVNAAEGTDASHAPPGAESSSQVQLLSLTDVLNKALETNPRLLAARSRRQASEDVARSLRGRLLPTVHVSESFQHYDTAYEVAFGSSSFVAREQETNTFAASASQPITGLLHLSQDHAALKSDAKAMEAQVKAMEDGIREEVQLQYLKLFQARAMKVIAQTSQHQLDEQLGVARLKLTAGVLTNADLLRLQVARENAHQQEIQAKAQEDVAYTSLLALMGLSPDEIVLSFQEPTLEEPTESSIPALPTARSQALEKRPELTVAKLQAASALHRSRSKFFQLLPELNVEAAYANVQGQAFAPPESAYVGLRADWNVWEWGASWYAWRAANAQSDAARQDLEGQKQQSGLEVSAKLLQVQSTYSALSGARAAVTSAEEAYRVTDVLVKAGSATTTDLLDAQSALVQARLNLVRAQYEQAMARVSLQRAMGG